MSCSGGESWDVVVVGAGPAGATAALAALHADPSLRVLVVDRSDFPRDKSCGDGIAPHCFEKLASIGVTGVEAGWSPVTKLELARGDQSVALRYAREENDAPVVLAKGQDLIALKIREIAEQNGIPVFEDPPLARSMFAQVSIDSVIPSVFYKAVAELIHRVYAADAKNKRVR
jgi:type III secretion system FlhB-like substrate exporter